MPRFHFQVLFLSRERFLVPFDGLKASGGLNTSSPSIWIFAKLWIHWAHSRDLKLDKSFQAKLPIVRFKAVHARCKSLLQRLG